MVTAASMVGERVRFTVRQGVRTVREILRRIRGDQRLLAHDLVGNRAHGRAPVQMPIYVTPAAFDGICVEPLEGPENVMLAVTRDVSLRGVGFTHDEPFLADYAIVTFDLWGEGPVSLLLEIRWSNLGKNHAYMSGGTFLGITETPGC